MEQAPQIFAGDQIVLGRIAVIVLNGFKPFLVRLGLHVRGLAVRVKLQHVGRDADNLRHLLVYIRGTP
jgi:hypothetical protein